MKEGVVMFRYANGRDNELHKAYIYALKADGGHGEIERSVNAAAPAY